MSRAAYSTARLFSLNVCAGHFALRRLAGIAKRKFCCPRDHAISRAFGTSGSNDNARKEYDDLPHKAYVALGSNLGDRIGIIEKACKLMEEDGDIKISRTSSLYETEPMYVTDQNSFINGACEVGLLV